MKLKYIYSATDVSNFEVCKCHIINKVRKLNGDKLDETPPSRTMLEYQKQGIQIEEDYLDKINSNKKLKLINISSSDTKQRLVDTKAAFEVGADYIYQAKLVNSELIGFPDFLKKVATPSNFGDYSYEVIDIKRSKEPKQENITQLLLYTFLLSEIQGTLPENIIVINGKSHKENIFKVSDFYQAFLETKNDFLEYVLSLEHKTNEELQSTLLNECEYNSKNSDKPCDTKPHELDLINVVDLSKKQRKKLQPLAANLKELAKLKPTKIKGISINVLIKLIRQAAIQYKKILDNESTYEILTPLIENRGFNKLPKQNSHDLFFDMEGNPTVDGGHEYLFGVIDGSTNKFISYWAKTINDEEKAFEEIMDFLYKHVSKYPEAHIYHYNHYEVTNLKRLSFKYNNSGDILDFLLKNKKFIDLFKVVRQAIITSELSRSIKDLEVFYMDKRTTEVTSGANSIDQFLEWIEFQDNKILQQIEDYNKDDCISTKLLLEWLHKIRPSDSELKSLDEIKPLDVEKTEEYKKIKKKILTTKNTLEPIKQLTLDMIEFHKREDKSAWWQFFDRFEKDYDELIDDREAIAACEKVEYSYDEKGFPLLAMKYPNQEFKIVEDKKIVNLDTGKTIGTILNTDYRKQSITIKAYGKNKSLDEFPEFFNLGAEGPPPVQKLQSAMSLFAEEFIKQNTQKSISDLLSVNIPRFKENFTLSNASKTGDRFQLIYDAVDNLDNSYLFIQGPPGTGKTYSSAKVILDLLKKGKKIAISSNSHKAINNLLLKIDDFSKDNNFTFKGLKKFSGSLGNKYESRNITATTTSRPVTRPYKKGVKLPLYFLSDNYQLLACTKYELADPDYRNEFDYLFIDEAGQASIADVVISALVAKNLVLIGDPQQLSQPSSIIHPGDSGMSVLEYILRDESTVKNDKGIFINETRRLNAPINKFISSLFYDGRLNSHESTNNRKLLFKDTVLGINEGILLIETNHNDNSQNSEEEIVIVKKLYDYLLNQQISIDGITTSITPNDILVVAPYNVQVNQLSQNLPKNNRTGTVDKFQGQEAAISILSMTASDAEDAPRGMDFLFDHRRLNVAISRAQCLSIVVMNKKLFKSRARNINQIMISNNFQKLKKYATILDESAILKKL
ncbi:TM0106 family RecB-like putative nuclease [Pelagibacterales bacterium]|nr:TM0106 family RecB-like putative nuclease [Pelagibacterales bacterium]